MRQKKEVDADEGGCENCLEKIIEHINKIAYAENSDIRSVELKFANGNVVEIWKGSCCEAVS